MEQSNPAANYTRSSPITRTTSNKSIPRTPLLEAPLTRKVILICAFSPFCGILFGYDSAYINGILAMCAFKMTFGHSGWVNNPEACQGYLYDSWQKSLITSILSAGTLIGALSSGYFADWFGRRISIILGCLVYIVGVAIQIIAQSVGLLIGGRVVAGLGVGIVSATNVMYVSEIAPQRIRGRVLGLYQFSITVGLLLASCVAYSTKDYDNSAAYRIVIGLQLAWPLILILGLSFMPESPRYHIMKQNEDRAKESLATLRDQPIDSEFVIAEHAELRRSYTRETQAGSGGNRWLDCFSGGFNKGSNLHRTFIGTTIQTMQQLTGVNFIFYFGTSFFQGIGIGDSFKISIILSTVNTATTPIAFWTIDRFGRRILLIWGAVGMCICEFIIAAVGVAARGHSAHLVLIVFVSIYISHFACTWGPAAWTVSGEIFPLAIRAKGIALSTASNWLWNFIIAFITPYIVDKDKGNLGEKVFFIWGSTCAACILFAYFCVYETKGLSLEQVNDMMEQCSARESPTWIPSGVQTQNGDVEMAQTQSPESAPGLPKILSDDSRGSRRWGPFKRKSLRATVESRSSSGSS